MALTSEIKPFGSLPDGTEPELIKIYSGKMELLLTNYGARIVSLKTPDRNDKLGEIIMGHKTLADYLKFDPHFRCTTGRVANRIANAEFELDGVTYELPKNNLDKHCLHGGNEGFAKKVWEVREVQEQGEMVTVTFAFTSPDGDQGFPGNLDTVVKYSATEGGLEIDYTATTDAPTIVALTNHCYWNLAGVGPTVEDLQLAIPASTYTVTDDELIPTGEIVTVEGTDLDFREMKPLRDAIANTGGIDTNFVLDKVEGMDLAAQLYSPATGRGLTIETDQPGIQLYTGNFLEGQKAWGKPCVKYQALCLETQKFSDAVHHENFPSVVLRPGDTYRHVARHFFKVGDTAQMCFEEPEEE